MDRTLSDDHHYIYDHAQMSSEIERFIHRHPDFPLIINIRDLRDIIVSQAFHVWKALEEIIGPSSLEEKITFLLDPKTFNTLDRLPIVYKHAEHILRFFNNENVLVVRFEDLIGSKGGGNDLVQRATIRKIAHHIGTHSTEETVSFVQSILFGDEVLPEDKNFHNTFRSGQIGSWRDIFNTQHLQMFNKTFGHLQQKLGYTLD